MFSIQIAPCAAAEPPTSAVNLGTGGISGGPMIAPTIVGAEIQLIVLLQGIWQRTPKSAFHQKLIVVALAVQPERGVLRPIHRFLLLLQLHSQLMIVAIENLVDELVAEPEIPRQIAETRAILIPAAIEVLGGIEGATSVLDHRPGGTIGGEGAVTLVQIPLDFISLRNQKPIDAIHTNIFIQFIASRFGRLVKV
ncbi:hypothetical protein M5D96_002015 [Drosophila gunungcola]|uniref:Uncharacterized protein n=1 Tax=Drosophila gunungcola TaxID=103775 RepID=A0A9P9YZ90_9MUSC|nr:hypothetical protein M5D96_002015 [Drosophila gunungcola]